MVSKSNKAKPENIMHGGSQSKMRQSIDPELADTIKLIKHKKRVETQSKKPKNKSSSKSSYRKMMRDKNFL